jgi:hypothetical protein
MAEKKIGKDVYKFDEILGWEAFDLADLMLDVVGPFAQIIEAMVGSEGSKIAGEKAFVAAFAQAMRDRNSSATRRLMESLLSQVRVNNEPCVPGMKPGRLDEMIAVAVWAAEVQFGRFFDAGVLSSLMAQARTSSR